MCQPSVRVVVGVGEHLFLEWEGCDGTCLPCAVESQPFLIGTAEDGGLLMHVDLDSPRVGTGTGEALFREHGGTTDFLDRMNSVLLALYEGLQGTAAFIEALAHHELLEPFTLDVQLDDRSEEHTSELQSLMRISYAVFCLTKKNST